MKFIDTYKDLLRYKPKTFRDKFRKIALDAASKGFGLFSNMEYLFRKPRIQFLYIHHVFKDEEQNLACLLKILSRYHDYIPYSEAVQRILSGDIDKPYICISSDDGLKNNIQAAAIMNEFGAKGCFFICPSVIGEKDFNRIRDFSGRRLHFPPIEFMDWDDVGLVQKQGHEIGAHTMSHVNIARTGKNELDYEIAGCYKAISEKCGKPDHFAYPYGRFTDFTGYARYLVFSHGFMSCASAERGCHITLPQERIESGNLLIRRDHVLLSWPLRHILFFIARNSTRANVKNNFFPSYENSDFNQQP